MFSWLGTVWQYIGVVDTFAWQHGWKIALAQALIFFVLWRYFPKLYLQPLAFFAPAGVLALYIISWLMYRFARGTMSIAWSFLRHYSLLIGVLFVAVYQPEIRRGLVTSNTEDQQAMNQDPRIVEALTKGAFELANRDRSALIVVERLLSVEPIFEPGESGIVTIDADVSAELLTAIFSAKKTTLYDGAVRISRGRIASAASGKAILVALQQRVELDLAQVLDVGRLRIVLASALTEESDVLVIVVDGKGVSLVHNAGTVERNFGNNREAFKRRLVALLRNGGTP